MSTSKKTIQFTAIASIILLIITYLVTVNIETNWLSIDSPWISNNFFLAFFGGAFASMIVVLICEIQKFCSMKKSTEAFLFSHAVLLYMQLYKMQENIVDYEDHPEEEITKSFFDEPLGQVQNELSLIHNTDYTRFSSKNEMLIGYRKLQSDLRSIMPSIFGGKSALEVSIIEVKKRQLEKRISEIQTAMSEQNTYEMLQVITKQNTNVPITAKNPPISDVLAVHKKHCTKAMEYIDAFIILLDKENNGAFNWAEYRESTKNSFPRFFDAWSLQKYLEVE